MRAFVHHPQVVVLVEADPVPIAQSVNPLAELANQFAGGVELQKLRGGVSVKRAGSRAAGVIQHHNRAFGINGDAQHFA